MSRPGLRSCQGHLYRWCSAGRDGQVYPVIVNSSEQVIAWLPNSSDLAVPGTGMLEVRLYLDDAICKSAIINTATSRALGAPVVPPPAPAPDWVTTARQ